MNKMYHCRAYLFCVHELLGLSIPEIAEECRVSYTTIDYWLKNKPIKTIIEKKYCEFCGKSISFHKIKCISKIINVKQNPVIRYFCQKECKICWIKQIQNSNQLEKKYFQETGKISDQEKNEYENWLNERFEKLKRTFEEIKENE